MNVYWDIDEKTNESDSKKCNPKKGGGGNYYASWVIMKFLIVINERSNFLNLGEQILKISANENGFTRPKKVYSTVDSGRYHAER